THWEHQGEGDEWLCSWWGGVYNAELGNVVDVDCNAVETIADIKFDEVDGAEGWVGKQYLTQDTLKGVTELHCFHGGEGQGIGIDVPPTVVTDPAGSTLALGYYTWGRNTEARKMLDGRVRKDYPLTFVDHVNEFFVEEVHIFVAGFVRAPVEGALNLTTSPWWRGKFDGRAVVLVEVQQTAGRVVHIG
ncbi:MAG: hypothetical protein ACRCT2_10595, partial [Plesiomonas shigelloides]